MDEYTRKTKICLEKEFNKCEKPERYHIYQNRYGFRQGGGVAGFIEQYIRAYPTMKSLSHLNFGSLVDVGGYVGYMAYIIKQLFGVKVEISDLCEGACKKAEEMFHIKSIPADVHDLPFKDNKFDVVLCTETLEHVADLHKVIDELLRVARKAIVITVPHEPKEVIDNNIEKEIPHAHIHSFDLESFNFLRSDGYHVLSRKMISPLLRIPAVLIEAVPREHFQRIRLPKILVDSFNAAIPILRKVFGKKAAAFLIRLDYFVCKFTPYYDGILFIIFKDSRCWRKKEIQNISAYRIMNITVPYHCPGKNEF